MSEAEEEGGAALRARHRSTMAELGAGGDSHRGGDGALWSETGDCTAGADAGPAGGGRRAGGVGSRRAPAVPSPARPRPGTAGPTRRAPGLGARLPSAHRGASAARAGCVRVPRPADPGSGRPSPAPPRLSHNRWKLARECGREEELENAGRSPPTCRPGSNSV